MTPIRRHTHFSQLYVEKKLPTGNTILVPYVEDLTDDQLQEAFEHWIDREDYEYVQVLCAEANSRGFNLKLNC